MSRLTWTKPNGDWGIEGVDLGALPPRAYAAAYKLKKYEDRVASLDELDCLLDKFEELRELYHRAGLGRKAAAD